MSIFFTKTSNIAVILPIYYGNNLDEFRLSLKSLLRQSIPIDIFIGCDGPIKPELQIYINEIIQVKSNIYLHILNKNFGLATILNECINVCLDIGYNYIGRMDADDFSVKNRFKIQYNFLYNNPEYDIVGCNLILFSKFNKKNRSIMYYESDYSILVKCFVFKSPLPHPGVLFRASIFNNICYSINYYLNEDYYLWLQMILNGIKFSNISHQLLYFRVDESMYKRRIGFRVAISDLRIRFKYIYFTRNFQLKNIFYTIGSFLFKLLPFWVIKKIIYVYKLF